jgi:hypothetical protein
MGLKKIVQLVLVTALGFSCFANAQNNVASQGSTVVYSTSPNGEDVLDNGIVRLTFDSHTGQFAAQPSQGGVLRMYDAGPANQKDGRTVQMEGVTVKARHEEFKDTIGEGEKLVIDYPFQDSTDHLRYELSVYKGKPWISATAFLPAGNYQLKDFSVVQSKIRTLAAFKTRVYVNSGKAGGDTGVWPLGMRLWNSSTLSTFYEPRVHEALGVGFYTFYRAITSVSSQYLSANTIRISANAHYNNYRPSTGELKTESLLLNFSRDPLKTLDEWADASVAMIKPKVRFDAHTGYLNTWYMYGDQTTQEDTIKQAQLLRDSILPGYGIKIVTTGEWQLQRTVKGDLGGSLGFGEDQEDQHLFPKGIKWLVDQMHGMGLQASFGANYCYAAFDTAPAKNNAPWVLKEDQSRLDFGYPIDFTNPAAREWLAKIARRTADYKVEEWWSDFMGGPTRGKLYDQTKIMGFEDVREGLRTIRDSIGPSVLMEPYCCGQYFAYPGLIDRDRTGNDIAGLGDFEGLKAIARQLAGTYMLHQRFWVNDSDPLYIGGRDYVHNYGTGPIRADSTILDEVRMRLQYQLTTGSFVTVGQNLEDFDAERMRLLTLVLPTYGQSARPLDMFEHTVPEVYDLPIKTDWDQWHVLVLQNWNDEGRNYNILFLDLKLDENKNYLVYRFWDQTFLGEFRKSVDLKLEAQKGETFAIRELPDHPWPLSTDMHLTQGGVELQGVKYDSGLNELSGTASRHPGAERHLVVYVPPGYKIKSASGSYAEEERPSGAAIVRLKLEFKDATLPWAVNFSISGPSAR